MTSVLITLLKLRNNAICLKSIFRVLSHFCYSNRSRSIEHVDGVAINALLGAILEQIDKTHSRTPRLDAKGFLCNYSSNDFPACAQHAPYIIPLKFIFNSNLICFANRFGKRGNDYMTKEFTNNYLRYLLENPPEVKH